MQRNIGQIWNKLLFEPDKYHDSESAICFDDLGSEAFSSSGKLLSVVQATPYISQNYFNTEAKLPVERLKTKYMPDRKRIYEIFQPDPTPKKGA